MESIAIGPATKVEEPQGDSKLQEGLRAFEECRWLDAVACLRKALYEDPEQPEITGKLAFALSQARKYDEAVEVLTSLCKNQPKSAKWPYMLGYQFYMRGDWKQAIEWFDKALSLSPTYVKVLYRKAYAHFQLGKHDDCVKALQDCIRSWQGLSHELQQSDRKIYGKANFLLGKAYLSKGLSLKARRPFETAVQMDDEDPDRRYELGKCLLMNRDITGAIGQLEKANVLRPGTDYVLDRLAQAYVHQGDLQKAEELYLAIPKQRRRPFVLKNLGTLYLEQGRVEAALEILQLASRRDHGNHNVQYLLGKALEAAGRHQAAMQAYQAAVDLKHQNYGSDFRDAQEAVDKLKSEMPELEKEIQPTAPLGPGEQVGVIDHYNDSRGFGFIQSSGQKIFFHVTAIVNGHRPLEGASVVFLTEHSEKGPKALQVRFLK